MKGKGECIIEGCGRPAVGLGLCNRHWLRNKRHGSPTGGGTGMGAAQSFYLSALTHSSDECLLWPYAIGPRDGYARMRFCEQTVVVHRLVLEKTAGPSPHPDLQAAHNCGVKRCVNPKHLRWATRLDNVEDTIRHGTRRRGEAVFGSKLKTWQIPLIRADERHPREICKDYHVGVTAIRQVKSGKTWSHVQ